VRILFISRQPSKNSAPVFVQRSKMPLHIGALEPNPLDEPPSQIEHALEF